MLSVRNHLFAGFLFVWFVCLSTFAQNGDAAPAPCGMLSGLKSASGHNLFSEQQEEWLAELMEKEVRADFNVIEDPENYLQKVGDRLLAQLPPSNTHYRFVIIDTPELNSYGLVGGRIFIHRRMIAFVQNEDELAALLGHEIGHMVDHHVVLRFSDWFRQMGVTTLGDRQDVLHRWKQFEDTTARLKHGNDERREAEEQLIADRIAFYALTRAGYSPERALEFFDRLFETKRKPGNFWTDFFGMTNPNGKRLREMMKSEQPLARNCIVPGGAYAGHFADWQKTIIASTKFAGRSNTELPGLIRKVTLQPQLRTDLYHVQFSPDGKYLLAQDESSIFVATRDPLASLFRIDALDAHAAQFTPDSRSLVFYDKELRIEKWDVAAAKRTSVHQLAIPDCFQAALSPSGAFLGCIDNEFGIKLVDVETNTVIFKRKDFYAFSYWGEYFNFLLARLTGENIRLFDMKFSPDERYFLAGHADSFLAYDTRDRAEAHLPGKIKGLARYSFAFTAPDEFAGLQYDTPKDMKLVRVHFPSGDKIDDFKVEADGWLSNTGNPDCLLMRPAAAYPVGIVDLKARKITQAFQSPAFAVYGQVYAGEQNSGELALFNTGDSKMIGKLQLPESRLGSSRTSVFSADGKWLAVSQGTRGSLWKLDSGERIFLARGFDGALFENDQLITKFAKDIPYPSRVFQFDLSGETNKKPTNKKLYDVVDAFGNARSWQWGGLLIGLYPDKPKQALTAGHITLQVRDVHNNNLLWERKLHHDPPSFFYSPAAITLLISDLPGIKEIAGEDPALSARLSKIDDKQASYLLQAIEPQTGKTLGSVLVDTGKLSFKVTSGFTVGDKMFVGDSRNRTLIYSLKSGEQKSSLIGHVAAVSAAGDKVLIENESGVADLYDTSDFHSLAHFSFSARIVDADFNRDGSLFVLTSDQNVYQLTTDQQRTATQ
jgi:WD40 repeat protein